jgi:hypothetical protein
MPFAARRSSWYDGNIVRNPSWIFDFAVLPPRLFVLGEGIELRQRCSISELRDVGCRVLVGRTCLSRALAVDQRDI